MQDIFYSNGSNVPSNARADHDGPAGCHGFHQPMNAMMRGPKLVKASKNLEPRQRGACTATGPFRYLVASHMYFMRIITAGKYAEVHGG